MRALSFFPSPAALGLAGLFLAPALVAQTSFGPQQVVNTLSGATAVSSADLDGDGDLDVLWAASGVDLIAWQPNDGAGNFGPQQIIDPAVDGPWRVYAADMDGDGDLDVLATARNAYTIVWYANDGSGNFGPQQVVGNFPGFVYQACAADLDGDGDLDVATAFGNGLYWYANDGSGNFGPQQVITSNSYPYTLNVRSVYVADIDGDGDNDVVGGGRYYITWWPNDGSGNFGPFQSMPSASGTGMSLHASAADFDGDGDLDVLSLEGQGFISWYENDGTGNFGPPQFAWSTTGAEDVYAADLDGDGDIDVVSANDYSSAIGWYENDGAGNFGPEQAISTACCVLSVYPADLDGDGDLDVLASSTPGGINGASAIWHENSPPIPAEVLGAGCAGLSLSGNPMQLNSSWDLQLGSVAATSPFGVFFVGGAALEPGVPLTATCTAYTTADLGFFLQPVVAGASTWSLTVPNDPSLVGAQLTVQGTAGSADPTAWNGIALSNGLRGTVGQ